MTRAVSLADEFPACVDRLGGADIIPELLFVEHCWRVGLNVRRSREIISANLVRAGGVRLSLTG